MKNPLFLALFAAASGGAVAGATAGSVTGPIAGPMTGPIASVATSATSATVAPATAGATVTTGNAEPLAAQVRQLAVDGTRTLAADPRGLRVEVQVGALDARLKLAPCEHAEPYLAPGTRLWGRTRVGVRCLRGPVPWNVYLPVTVKVHGRALVATGPLPAGAVLSAADLLLAEVDLAEDASAAVDDTTRVEGRALQRPLSAGQSLRQSHLKPRVWFTIGDVVQVRASGNGYSVGGEGQALTRGVEGEPARVRTDAGRVLSGLPVADRRMDMALQ